MPCLVLLVGALFLKAFSTWIQHSSGNKLGDSSSEHASVRLIIIKTLNLYNLLLENFIYRFPSI